MSYWWVNHNQTFAQEFRGGYIWCPKRKQNGQRNRYYDYLCNVRPGDVVFSYARTLLQGAGYATSYCYTCPRPEEFGHIGLAWDLIGWRVDVNFLRFEEPLRVIDHADTLAATIRAEPYSPVRRNGYGLQHVYLTALSNRFANELMSLVGDAAAPFREGNLAADAPRILTEELLKGRYEWEKIEEQKISQAEIRPTQKKALVYSRIGQGLFKQRVAEIEHACRVTNVCNPAHLTGSHIKPWRESDNEERLCGANGLLLTPSIDHLFDRGFISFEDGGDLIISDVADKESLEKMGVLSENRPRPRQFNQDQQHFLDYHREEILLRGVA